MSVFYKLIQEASVFSDNFKYYPPHGFSELLADFYALTALRNQLRSQTGAEVKVPGRRKTVTFFNNVIEAHEASTQAVRNYFLTVIPYLVSVELRHLHRRGYQYLRHDMAKPIAKKVNDLFGGMNEIGYHNKFNPERKVGDVVGSTAIANIKYDDYRLNDPDPTHKHPEVAKTKNFLDNELITHERGGRDTINQTNYYKFFVNHFGSVDKLIDFAIEVFPERMLWYSNYGGETWSEIAKSYKKLKNTTGIFNIVGVIDDIVDLEHNTGSAFNKIAQIRKPYTTIMGNTGYNFNWFPEFLDAKAQHPTPHGYYENLSPKAQQLVAAFYKAQQDFTREDYHKVLDVHERPRYGGKPSFGSTRELDLYKKHKHMVKSREEIIPKTRR